MVAIFFFQINWLIGDKKKTRPTNLIASYLDTLYIIT